MSAGWGEAELRSFPLQRTPRASQTFWLKHRFLGVGGSWSVLRWRARRQAPHTHTSTFMKVGSWVLQGGRWSVELRSAPPFQPAVQNQLVMNLMFGCGKERSSASRNQTLVFHDKEVGSGRGKERSSASPDQTNFFNMKYYFLLTNEIHS